MNTNQEVRALTAEELVAVAGGMEAYFHYKGVSVNISVTQVEGIEVSVNTGTGSTRTTRIPPTPC
jgi:hypothetical protein